MRCIPRCWYRVCPCRNCRPRSRHIPATRGAAPCARRTRRARARCDGSAPRAAVPARSRRSRGILRAAYRRRGTRCCARACPIPLNKMSADYVMDRGGLTKQDGGAKGPPPSSRRLTIPQIYFGGSAPGCASSMGNVVAPEELAGAGSDAGGLAASGVAVALLELAMAFGARPLAVLARMARSKRLAASTLVVTRRAMMSEAGALWPYSPLFDLLSMLRMLPSSATPANRPRLREYE